MASRTREKLIESAKLLFIRKGVENTTISDIANASDKGRRTIYTYFKNKREIYNAVIERESDRLVGELGHVLDIDAPAAERLKEYARLRTAQRRNSQSTYAAIKKLLSMGMGRNERVRRLAWEKESTIVGAILDQGVAGGEFDPESVRTIRKCLFQLLRSIDLVAADSEIATDDDFGPSLIELLIRSIRR